MSLYVSRFAGVREGFHDVTHRARVVDESHLDDVAGLDDRRVPGMVLVVPAFIIWLVSGVFT